MAEEGLLELQQEVLEQEVGEDGLMGLQEDPEQEMSEMGLLGLQQDVPEQEVSAKGLMEQL